MLSFFSKQPDHPLADPQQARRVCAEIAARPPQDAVDEAAAWLESLAGIEGFKPALRLERVLQIDEAAVAQVRRLGREFISSGRPSRAQDLRAWETGRGYWLQLLASYGVCLERLAVADKEAEATRPQLGLLLARMVHAQAGLLKWDQFRYGPIGNDYWAEVGSLYLQADAAGLARKSLTLYAGSGATSVEAEYLKVLLFHASSMDKLLPVEIELTERLIAHLLRHFRLTTEVRPENVYWVDAARALPPTRLARLPEISPSLRFFSGGEALAVVERLRGEIAADHRVPPEVNLGGQYSQESVLAVLDHLAVCWAPKPPMRGHARHRVKSRLVVAHGMEAVHGYISGRLNEPSGVEMWVVDDVSQGGMGALVPISRQDWVRIGVLVAMQPEGGANWLLGVVRRFARLAANQGQVGIETLSKTPYAVLADAGGLQTEAIVLDLPEVGEYARMALPPVALEDKVALLFEMDGKRARFHPRETLEQGDDYVIAKFFVQSYS